MITREVYLNPILYHTPRLLGMLNRNISSSAYGCFDREFWHYNTIDIACARKQEATLTISLLFTIDHEHNLFYRSDEILQYIIAAMKFFVKIQNNDGSFNEWYPNEHSFVVTSFSSYAISESLLLLGNNIPEEDHFEVMKALEKAGDWLIKRHERRVMNQQTGAAITLYNLYLLTRDSKYLDASKDKISLLKKRQTREGWFIEYGGPDVGYLSLAIDYLSKYLDKTGDLDVKDMLIRALGFLKHFIQPSLVAGGEYTSRNTEYLIPHGFEILSRVNEDARFVASAIRKKLCTERNFPTLYDDRYLLYNGYTWLQAFLDANAEIDNNVDKHIREHFDNSFREHLEESGMFILNDSCRHLIVNMKKGGAFRLYDKKSRQTYSDSGILVRSGSKWFTSGWLAASQREITEKAISVSGSMWKIPDKSITPLKYILLRIFQMTLGHSVMISLWVKERLRDILITKTRASKIRYNRKLLLDENSDGSLTVRDAVQADKNMISSIAVFAKDTHIYVPSSRYYVNMSHPPFRKTFSPPVGTWKIEWKIGSGTGVQFGKGS